jgi:hypothetical protein
MRSFNNFGKISEIYQEFIGWMDCQWWSSTPARGPQDKPNMQHGLYLMFTITHILYLSWIHGRFFFCVECIWFSRQSVAVNTGKSLIVF